MSTYFIQIREITSFYCNNQRKTIHSHTFWWVINHRIRTQTLASSVYNTSIFYPYSISYTKHNTEPIKTCLVQLPLTQSCQIFLQLDMNWLDDCSSYCSHTIVLCAYLCVCSCWVIISIFENIIVLLISHSTLYIDIVCASHHHPRIKSYHMPYAAHCCCTSIVLCIPIKFVVSFYFIT